MTLAIFVLFLGTITAVLKINQMTLPLTFLTIKFCTFSTVHMHHHVGDPQGCLFGPALFTEACIDTGILFLGYAIDTHLKVLVSLINTFQPAPVCFVLDKINDSPTLRKAKHSLHQEFAVFNHNL